MPTVTFTYTQTGDFGYGTTGIETKTIEWVVSSSLPIQGGTFLDGSPWVVNNGDINLISTSPVSSSAPIKVLRREAFDPALNGSPVSIQTLNVDINNTIINPDLGKIRAADDVLVRADGSGVTTAAEVFVPWDGRAGRARGNAASYNLIGTAYDSTQKWNRQPRKLNNGDMVAVAVSHYTAPTGTEAIVSGLTASSSTNIILSGVFDGTRSPQNQTYAYLDITDGGIVDMIGCLTVVSSVPSENSFRPPCNWDPSDRANAPIFQEVNTLEDSLLDYPNYSIGSNTKDWMTTAYGKYTSNTRYSSIDPYLWHYTVDPAGMRGYRESRFCFDPYESEYGSTIAKALETSVFAAHTTDSTPEVRARVRRAMAQRGIDLYGARVSLGKTFFQNRAPGGAAF